MIITNLIHLLLLPPTIILGIIYNKNSTDRGNTSVSGFSPPTSIYNTNYNNSNIKTGNRRSLNDLVKHNAILRHMNMFDNESNNMNDVFVTSLPTTLTMRKASIRRIRKRIHQQKSDVKDGEKVIQLKVFNKEPKKQDILINLPTIKEEKINFSDLLNNSLTNMGYLKSYNFKNRDIRKLQSNIEKVNKTSNVQRYGLYFNEASIPSLINVDNDITQYEDNNKIMLTTMKVPEVSRDLMDERYKKVDNFIEGVSNFIEGKNQNLPFTVTEAFEREFDLFTSKDQLSKEDESIKNKSLLISTTSSPPTITVTNKHPLTKTTKESNQLNETEPTPDDRDSYKIFTYSKTPQQHLTFITKSQINGMVEENSVKKVMMSGGGNNIIKLPNILMGPLNDNIKNSHTYNGNNNEIKRIENSHIKSYINDNDVTRYYNKNYAFGSLLQPIVKDNGGSKLSDKPYIFDIPSPVKLPTAKMISQLPYQIVDDPVIQEKVVKIKNEKDNKNMVVGGNLLKFYPNNLYPYGDKDVNEIDKKDSMIPLLQFGNKMMNKDKPTYIEKSYDKESYHSSVVLRCFVVKEDYYVDGLVAKGKRINISEKECAMFCSSHSECLFVAFHRNLNVCDFFDIQIDGDSKRYEVEDERRIVQKYGYPIDGINLLFPNRKDGGILECIKKLNDEEKSTNTEEGVVIDSEELEFMDTNNIGESRMKTDVVVDDEEGEEEVNENDMKTKRKALGSTMFIVKSDNNDMIKNMIENVNITSNNEELLTFQEPLNDNNGYHKSFPVSMVCPKGEKQYYIKSEGYQLGENLSKSRVIRSTLKKCQDLCSDNLSLNGYTTICLSFSFDFVKKECHLYEKGSNFEGNNHLIKNGNSNHYESICLQESLIEKCKNNNKYPIRIKQKILIGYAIDSFKLLNAKQCFDKCLNNVDCQSITYFHDSDDNNCILNSEHSPTDSNSFITVQNSNTVDFFSLSGCQKNFPKNMMGVI